MNVRTDGHGRRVYDGEQVQIGGNATYRSACPQCFYGERDAASSGHG
jgi:thymidine kinase